MRSYSQDKKSPIDMSKIMYERLIEKHTLRVHEMNKTLLSPQNEDKFLTKSCVSKPKAEGSQSKLIEFSKIHNPDYNTVSI
jgi:hypothetical protein